MRLQLPAAAGDLPRIGDLRVTTYRVGNHQPRNLYRGNNYIGVCFDPADTALIVDALESRLVNHIEQLREALTNLIDDDPCTDYDHHGQCQTHMATIRGVCAHARAKELLGRADQDHADEPHHYLSTACLHNIHNDCDIDTRRYDGTWKHGASCKYCRAPCVCPHHKRDGEHTERHQ